MTLRVQAPKAPSSSLELTSAGDVETLTRAHGTSFLVTNKKGDITPSGACELGLLFDDTRYLSHYELSIRAVEVEGSRRELPLVHLSSDAFESRMQSDRPDGLGPRRRPHLPR